MNELRVDKNSNIFNSALLFVLKEIVLPKKYRTTVPYSPKIYFEPSNDNVRGKDELLGNLLTRQALKTYEAPSHIIEYKYSEYSKSVVDLPR